MKIVKDKIRNKDLFLTDNSIAIDLIRRCKYPFEVLPYLDGYILFLGSTLDSSYEQVDDSIWIAKDAIVAPNVSISGPCIIDHEAEIIERLINKEFYIIWFCSGTTF